MKLQELQTRLTEKKINSTYSKISNEFVNQERVYLNINKQFLVYFIQFDDKPFLKVYIQRPKNFDFKNIKQSELETERCKKAKLQFLNAIKFLESGIQNLEEYENWNDVQLSPKSEGIKIEVNI
ncbi:hypothetical protein [Delftia sp. JD2]|uniref:hypothetical protein n=1 Tax=Delftia sp. JD2 TaxID=469553 RepID=UPI0011123108|nr:hypothetical protein [Delftia sp. JD2]